jgi:c-di-GMP-binding flagellar brake protein YcgR
MDRRNKSRIDLQLTCYIAAGKVQAAPVSAITENVSRTGMLMRWSAGAPLPELGGKLTVDVQLPENSGFGPRIMRCRAEVIRMTPRGDQHEVALRVASMRFIKPSSRPARSPISEKLHPCANPADLASWPVMKDWVI